MYFASIFKMKTKKKKRKHTHIGYFFFKVPDSQKSDNLKQQEKQCFRFRFLQLGELQIWDSLAQEGWAYLDPHSGSHNLKKKQKTNSILTNPGVFKLHIKCSSVSCPMDHDLLSLIPFHPLLSRKLKLLLLN